MGLIRCSEHGDQDILQLSDKLYSAFSDRVSRKIKCVTFFVDGLEDIEHFMCADEELDWVVPGMDYDYFSIHFRKISAAKPVCLVCFQQFLSEQNIVIEDVPIQVTG